MVADKNKLYPVPDGQHKNAMVHAHGQTDKRTALMHPKTLGELMAGIAV